jgi:hypothetical protein
MRTRTLLFSASLLVGSFLIPVGSSFAQTDANRAPDNTAVNQRDRAPENLTPMIAAGPILAALSGAAAGGAVGTLAGALVGLGIPEYEAKQYEGKVKNGNILISVHTEDSRERKAAKEIFDRVHADDVSSAGEARV